MLEDILSAERNSQGLSLNNSGALDKALESLKKEIFNDAYKNSSFYQRFQVIKKEFGKAVNIVASEQIQSLRASKRYSMPPVETFEYDKGLELKLLFVQNKDFRRFLNLEVYKIYKELKELKQQDLDVDDLQSLELNSEDLESFESEVLDFWALLNMGVVVRNINKLTHLDYGLLREEYLVTRQDFITIGFCALKKALSRWDLDKANSKNPGDVFTYTKYWVEARTKEAYHKMIRTVRLPEHASQSGKRLYFQPVAITDDKERFEEHELLLEDPDLDIESHVLASQVWDFLKSLGRKGLLGSDDYTSRRNLRILKARFKQGFTLEQISNLVGLSRERVRQIIDKSVEKAKTHFVK